MTNRVAEVVLNATYRDATKELLDLVMAAEKAFDNYGKRSFLGGDKGKDAEGKFTAALVLAVLALERVGKIKNTKDADESLTALNNAMTAVRRAYPNWPRAYKYWDHFYEGTYEK